MSISSSIRKPGFYTEANTSGALRGLTTAIAVLLVGQRLSTGTVAKDVLTPVQDADEARTFFGEGSQLSLMASAALKANPNMQLNCIAMDDAGAGVAAAGSVDSSGTATEAGTLTVRVGDRLAQVAITNGDSGATIATALATALGEVQDMPVTAAVGTPTTKVDITARNKGTQGNDIDIEVSGAPAGITITVVQLTSGGTDPDISLTLTIAAGKRFDLIAVSLNDTTSLQALRSHLQSVSGPLEQREGLGFAGYRDTLANATTLADAVNDGRVTIAHLKGTRTLSLELAAAFAAVVASETDPAAPLNGYEVLGVAAPDVTDRFTRAEQETLLLNGLTPLEVTAGERIRIVRWITTYQTNSSGNPDATLLDGTTLRSLDYFRQQWRGRMTSVFGPEAPATNRKLTDKNLRRIEAETLGLMFQLQDAEILENVDEVKDSVIASRSVAAQGRADVQIPANVVQGLHVVGATFNLRLS